MTERSCAEHASGVGRGVLVFVLLFACAFLSASGQVSKPGGAGHALLFRNNVLVKKDFKDFPTTALTFEAWVSTSDFCNSGTLLSYAKDSSASDEHQRVADFNHFVIFNPRTVLACHDFEFLDRMPDLLNESCHASYINVSGSRTTANLAERSGQWHHLAVTWTAASQGLTHIYMDGLLMATAYSQKTEPLVPGGALMIGGEQDCFGGCTDPNQGFNGLLDEVRIWRTARSQKDILEHMRGHAGLESEPDLVAYWKFNDADADDGQFRLHTTAKDSSTHGNHLELLTPPRAGVSVLSYKGSELQLAYLTFHNNFAINKATQGMPTKSFTIEMWARGSRLDTDKPDDKAETLLSYATQQLDASELAVDGIQEPTGFLDDGIRVERLQQDVNSWPASWLEPFWATSTLGAIRVHINSNEHSDAADNTAWIDFDAAWVDSGWHHVAITWDQPSGQVRCFFDGTPKTAFWRNDQGVTAQIPASEGGVEPHIAAGTARSSEGALVLGQDQDCFGGCFQSSKAFKGDIANVRVWNRPLAQSEILGNLGREHPESHDGLVALYLFGSTSLKPADGGGIMAMDTSGSSHHLALRSSPPLFMYSTAPLTSSDGRPVKPPVPGAGGYSLGLSDKQVLLHTNFENFPSTAITVEFWMWSVDGCRKGVPFSYATGSYGQQDNAFLLFNYNSWGVSVMEDEGGLGDHLSGVSATDGNWHHVAVTWESSTGKTMLYDNGRPVWHVTRGKGRSIPSGGTLVIGREQDCVGGCFDSAAGAAGNIQELDDQQYGAQDFFGVIEELRIWRVVRSGAQIRQGMDADDGRGPGGFSSPGLDAKSHPDLVAYYKFDEGQGYLVRDATGHRHDMHISQQPADWQVTRWLSTCGNGIVEGLEQCDDGDLVGGNGCSPHCRIEPGWECKGNPSVCHKKGHPPGRSPPAAPRKEGGEGGGAHPSHPEGGGPHPTPSHPEPGHIPAAGEEEAEPHGHSGSGSGGGGSGAGSPPQAQQQRIGLLVGMSILGTLVVLAGLVAAVPSWRQAVISRAPEAGASLRGLASRLTGGYVGGGYSGLSNLDPDMRQLLAPDFISASPASSAAPGHPGPFFPLSDGRQPGPGQA